jgi:energy-coupling factor transporter ATP-binding protein EcfA2
MNINDFKGLSPELIEFETTDTNVVMSLLELNQSVSLFMEGDVCLMAQGDGAYVLNIITQPSSQIVYQIQMQRTHWILSRIKGNRVWLSSIETLKNDIAVGDMDIGVADYFAEQLFKGKNIKTNDIESAVNWFNEEFLINQNQDQLAFALVYDNANQQEFNLLGREYLVKLAQINNYWSVQKLTRYRDSRHDLFCITGQVSFKDASVATQLRSSTAKLALQESISSHGSYISLWEQYSQTQWQQAVNQANQLGYITLKEVEPVEHEALYWHLYASPESIKDFEKKWNDLGAEVEKELQVSATQPDWLNNQKLVSETGLEKSKEEAWRAKIEKFEDDRIIVIFEGKKDKRPPLNKKGEAFVFLSIHGTLAQRQRQMAALDQIRRQDNPMPSLHYLLQGLAVPVRKSKNIKALSPKIRRLFDPKCKGNKPTQKQVEAIEVGLNTSDIAIIIGPPGTGKTQVISALQQRIAEENGDLPIQHQVLLSSYQHDAVDNVVARSNVLGLPAIRIGGKSNRAQENINPVRKWSSDNQRKIQHILDQHPTLEVFKQLQSACLALRLGSSTPNQHAEVIQEIDELLKLLAKENLYPNMERLEKWADFKQPKTNLNANLLWPISHYIWSLRTTMTSFADDGALRCLDVWVRLKEKTICSIDADDLVLLQQLASSHASDVTVEHLSRLSIIKDKILDACIPDYRPISIQKLLPKNECQLLDDLLEDIRQEIKKSKTLGYLLILDEYLSGLKANANTVEDAVSHYTAVLGATCQQAAGNGMQNIKLFGEANGIVFDSVIVDEAARATPLDLMIPMAMAKRRLVLVGDHRQLPHMLDGRVEEELAESETWNIIQQQMLEESLFQRMVNSLEKLHENQMDQPQRVVMLDTQFRMHQVLGDFISQNFYENKRLRKIKSERPDTDFIHGISGYVDRVCAWLNVPSSEGYHQRPSNKNNGWIRIVEAQRLVREAKRILDEKPYLSVGIITFYGDQRDCLHKELMSLGVVKKTAQGFEIVEAYKTLSEGENIGKERLRIGTVDAFQGKEFDVVIVSLVRTLKPNFHIDNMDEAQQDKVLTSAYGFLRVDNRLNVALSRQHSLLIMVGDLSLAQHQAAELAAPALAAFARLCGGNHGVIC